MGASSWLQTYKQQWSNQTQDALLLLRWSHHEATSKVSLQSLQPQGQGQLKVILSVVLQTCGSATKVTVGFEIEIHSIFFTLFCITKHVLSLRSAEALQASFVARNKPSIKQLMTHSLKHCIKFNSIFNQIL